MWADLNNDPRSRTADVASREAVEQVKSQDKLIVTIIYSFKLFYCFNKRANIASFNTRSQLRSAKIPSYSLNILPSALKHLSDKKDPQNEYSLKQTI
jgi:hypothetical protein